jgi:uncharacterized protein
MFKFHFSFYLKFIIAALITLMLFNKFTCNKNDNTNVNDTTKKSTNYAIKFIKQGEVFFQDKNKNLIKQIDIEIAETNERRHIGLMFREKMEENQGMLFIFQENEEQGFYMKNTLITLDIIFIDSKKQIIKIYKNTTPLSEESLPSGKPALYVVEVIGGFTNKFNIKEGDYIDFKKN